MSLQPTSRERETGNVSPFDVSASQDYGRLMEGSTVIDSPADRPGWTTVNRTPGREPQPHDQLTGDPSATIYGPVQPPIAVEHRHGENPTPTPPDALARGLALVEQAKARSNS